MAHPFGAVPVAVLRQAGLADRAYKTVLTGMNVQAVTRQGITVWNGVGDAVVLKRGALVGFFIQRFVDDNQVFIDLPHAHIGLVDRVIDGHQQAVHLVGTVGVATVH